MVVEQYATRALLKFLGFLVFVLFAATASGYAYRNWFRFDRPVQPVAFNHRLHVADAQIPCSECHAYYSKGQHSGLPSVDVCMTCHADALGKSQEEAKLRQQVERGQPVVFRKLFQLPAHVYYSHRRHVVLAKLECSRCHGNIANSQSPPSVPLVQITMNFCVDCHTQSKVTIDCKSCHR